eukprot:2260161-Rhodomonas_salina.3
MANDDGRQSGCYRSELIALASRGDSTATRRPDSSKAHVSIIVYWTDRTRPGGLPCIPLAHMASSTRAGRVQLLWRLEVLLASH